MPFYETELGSASARLSVPHLFTARRGGVSGGVYASLNLGTSRGDDIESVRENYRVLGAALGFEPEKLVFSRQVHGKTVRRVTAADSLGDVALPVPYEADGLITSERGLPLIVFSADCIPILLYDRRGRAVGAVHAGWRGTAADIAGEAVARLHAEFGSRPEDIAAAIGPGIGGCCFETGEEVFAAMEAQLPGGAGRCAVRRGDKYYIDLKAVNRRLLERRGVADIDLSTDCTRCAPEKYWSHRAHGDSRGAQAAVIMLP